MLVAVRDIQSSFIEVGPSNPLVSARHCTEVRAAIFAGQSERDISLILFCSLILQIRSSINIIIIFFKY